jgi:glycosyltransferase involved in cell wall biosynthesis
MRILFVSPHFPADVSRSVYGTFQRMRMWLEALQSIGTDLELLFFARADEIAGPDAEAQTAQQLEALWGIRSSVVICEREPARVPGRVLASYVDFYVRPSFGSWRQFEFRPYAGRRQREALARCIARSPDVVFFHLLHGTIPARSMSLHSARIFLDIGDVEHRKLARELSQPPRWPKWRLKPLLYLQLPWLWWGERMAIVRSNRAFVCSETDCQYVQRTMRVHNVGVVPNAVPRKDDGPLTTEPNVLFIGSYSYGPNVVAAQYLIREIWPHLVRNCPGARLLIAGPSPEAIPSFQDPPAGVEFLGLVSDLNALYRRARVLCCPIQTGGGTRIKILEAGSYGIPVVSTRLGAEGIQLSPDAEIIIRENARDLAQACAELLLDDGRARRIGTAARERVRALYSRETVVSRIRAMLEE